MKQSLFIILIVSAVSISSGQTVDNCDTVFSITETPAKYYTDMKGVSKYVQKELVPIISNCMKKDDEVIGSLYIALTIDKNGKVIDVLFRNPNLSTICRNELKKKLLTMDGWTAAKQNNQPVCSKFDLPISCINWR